MKLKIFNRSNTGGHVNSIPVLSISSEGLMTFNKLACDTFNLKVGDKIEFVQDEDKPKDWYFIKSKSEDSFKLRDSNKGGVLFNAAKLTSIILKSLSLESSKPYRCLIGQRITVDGKVFFPLVTASMK